MKYLFCFCLAFITIGCDGTFDSLNDVDTAFVGVCSSVSVEGHCAKNNFDLPSKPSRKSFFVTLKASVSKLSAFNGVYFKMIRYEGDEELVYNVSRVYTLKSGSQYITHEFDYPVDFLNQRYFVQSVVEGPFNKEQVISTVNIN